jgi:hypothetical protein
LFDFAGNIGYILGVILKLVINYEERGSGYVLQNVLLAVSPMVVENNQTRPPWLRSDEELPPSPYEPHQSNGEVVDNFNDTQQTAAHEESSRAAQRY